MGDGQQANNPWLQEMPDPISRVSWDNYLTVSKSDAKVLGIENTNDSNGALNSNFAMVSLNGKSIQIPVIIQPGQAKGSVGLSFGYGRWNYMTQVSLNHIETPVTSPDVDIWDEFDRSVGHHFNLSIDLNSCTGCGACVIACHAENNVPVVGKSEMRKSRDMHWLRIDRYYSSAETFSQDNITKDNISGLGDSLSVFGEMEDPSENPQVAFQPVMCQHCNHAPCETVCPVAATSHGRQGQNHMAYNRCVGTRYCANNCPYKVKI